MSKDAFEERYPYAEVVLINGAIGGNFKTSAKKGDTMKCEKCDVIIVVGDERDHQGQTLCEDCYMDSLSTIKACDPWATRSAQNFDNIPRHLHQWAFAITRQFRRIDSVQNIVTKKSGLEKMMQNVHQEIFCVGQR